MYINKFKKIVIKIGSSILIDKKGKLKKAWLEKFAKDIKFLIKRKKQVVIVSSGSIALGCEYLGIKKKKLKVEKSQAVASVGQIMLMDFYKKIFDKSKIKITAKESIIIVIITLFLLLILVSFLIIATNFEFP